MQLRTLFWVLLAQAVGGITPALTKLALAGLGPWSLIVCRQLLGTVFLVAMARFAWRRAPPGHPTGLRGAFTALGRTDWALVLLLSWAGFALPQILGALGVERSTATNGALLSPLEPIGILVGSALFLREPLTPPRLLAAALGIAGATLIVLPSASAPLAGDLRGDLLMALGHLAWAIYTLAAKPLLARHDPWRIAILASALSPLPLLPFAATETLDPARIPPALVWILLLAFLTTAVATFAWNRALRDVSAGTMAAFVFVQPVVGLVLGRLALGEPAAPQALAGAALIVVGVCVAALRGEPAPAPAHPQARQRPG